MEKLKLNQANNMISIGIMVKNQENRIRETMVRALNLCDHLIIIDTGSTDGTSDVIKANDSDKIEFHKILWTDNFSEMRNNIIALNKNKWLLFIDSDEIIDSKENLQDLKETLNLIDVLSKECNIAIQTKIWAAQYSSFSIVDRILRKEDGTKYFGKVHEEVGKKDVKVQKLRFDFHIHNAGLLPSERKKFDKKKIYQKLSKEELNDDINNPRWIANMENPEETSTIEELQDYVNFLRRGMLIDFTKPLSLKNLKESEHLHMIIGKYLYTNSA